MSSMNKSIAQVRYQRTLHRAYGPESYISRANVITYIIDEYL
jgi:hypothetical protein